MKRRRFKKFLKISGSVLLVSLATSVVVLTGTKFFGNDTKLHEENDADHEIVHELTDGELEELISQGFSGKDDKYYEQESQEFDSKKQQELEEDPNFIK